MGERRNISFQTKLVPLDLWGLEAALGDLSNSSVFCPVHIRNGWFILMVKVFGIYHPVFSTNHAFFFVSPTFLVNKKSPAYLHTDFNQFHPWNPWKCRSNMVRFLGCRFSPRASMKSALSPRIRHHWIHQHWLWWKGSKGPHGSPVRKDPKKLKSERPWNSGEHHEIKHSTSFSINLPWR